MAAGFLATGFFFAGAFLATGFFAVVFLATAFFAGAFLSGLCTIMLTGFWLQRTGRVTDEITVEHYHDLGKLLFAFVVFWAYIAFSQYMLYWYANIPEETGWYLRRSGGSMNSLASAT